MFQFFGRSRLGSLFVDSQVFVSVVSRWLPAGVRCYAVRLRAHDGLCLVVLSDRREFWSREDDLRRARGIVADLRGLGVELPRLQWVRQSRFLEERPPYVENSLFSMPLFWMNLAGVFFAFFVLSWKMFVLFCAVMSGAWLISTWLLSEGRRWFVRVLSFLKGLRSVF